MTCTVSDIHYIVNEHILNQIKPKACESKSNHKINV